MNDSLEKGERKQKLPFYLLKLTGDIYDLIFSFYFYF